MTRHLATFFLGVLVHVLWLRWRRWERGVDLEPVAPYEYGGALVSQSWKPELRAAWERWLARPGRQQRLILGQPDPPDARTVSVSMTFAISTPRYSEGWASTRRSSAIGSGTAAPL